MTTHVTLTDVMVDELRARAAKAERRAKALETVIDRIKLVEPALHLTLLGAAAKIEAEDGG